MAGRKLNFRSRRRIKKSRIFFLIVLALLSVTIVNEILIPSAYEQVTKSRFSKCDYFIEEYEERYLEYKKINSSLDIDDVVWQVNVDLDYGFNSKKNDAKMLLINKQNKLAKEYIPSDLVEFDEGKKLTKGAKYAFDNMKALANEEEIYIDIDRAYISYEEQDKLYKTYLEKHGKDFSNKALAKAGYSEHQSARSIELLATDDFENSKEHLWIKENCEDFGFIFRYTNENKEITDYENNPYHITFVGKDIALEMKEKGIKSLEEYLGKNPEQIVLREVDDRKAVLIKQEGNQKARELSQKIKSDLDKNNIRTVINDIDDKNHLVLKDENILTNIVISQNSNSNMKLFSGEKNFKLLKIFEKYLKVYSPEISKTDDEILHIDLNSREYKEEDINKLSLEISKSIGLFINPRKMYLTFDDGPVKGSSERILDILKERNVKASFFVLGSQVEKNPEILKRMHDEGHNISIHGYSHDYKKIYSSVYSFVQDFEKARNLVFEITGEKADIYRFPGGSINDYNRNIYSDIIKEMEFRGHKYFDWNASIDDTVRGASKDSILSLANISTKEQEHVVLLMHDTSNLTADSLNEILDLYPEYEMETIDNCDKTIQF